MKNFTKILLLIVATNFLSSCALFLAGGAGYVVGRELEEKQRTDEPEVYK